MVELTMVDELQGAFSSLRQVRIHVDVPEITFSRQPLLVVVLGDDKFFDEEVYILPAPVLDRGHIAHTLLHNLITTVFKVDGYVMSIIVPPDLYYLGHGYVGWLGLVGCFGGGESVT